MALGAGVDEFAQGVAGQRVIVAAGIDVFELIGLVIAAFGVGAVEEEAFDFVGGVEGVALLLVKALRVAFEDAADIGAVGRAVLIDNLTEDQHLAGAEDIGRCPVEGAPIHIEAKVAFALGGEAADGGAVKSQIVPALDKELLVVIEHVQAAFQVAEQDRDRLDALLVRQVPQALLLNLVHGHATLTLRLGSQVQFFQLPVGEGQKVLQFVGCHLGMKVKL